MTYMLNKALTSKLGFFNLNKSCMTTALWQFNILLLSPALKDAKCGIIRLSMIWDDGMIKRIVSLTLLLLMIISVCSCASNIYQTGVDYDTYQIDEVPIYTNAVVFRYSPGEDNGTTMIAFGTNDNTNDIIDFYNASFDAQEIKTIGEEGLFGAYSISGITNSGIQFLIKIYSANGELGAYFATIAEITIAHVDADNVETTISSALAAGILQYEPTGETQYDLARQQALSKISELTLSLYQKTKDALPYAAEYAQQLSGIWDRPRKDIQWPVLYGINSANISYLKALGFIDGFENEKLPADLKQTMRPLYALEAASCIEDAVMHLLAANGYHELFASLEQPENKGQHWSQVLQTWETAKPVLADMIGTTEQLSVLINEVFDVDQTLANEYMTEVQNQYTVLKDMIQDYGQDQGQMDTQTVFNTLDIWIQADMAESDTDTTRMSGRTSDMAVINPLIILENAWLNMGGFDEAVNRLNAAVEKAEQPLETVSVHYSTAYNTEDAENVIGLFLLMPMRDTLNKATPPAYSPEQDPAKPIKLLFTACTDNSKAEAFHTVVNATIQGTIDRGYDPDFATSVMAQENNTPDEQRDMIGRLMGDYHLQLLVCGALNAAEKRNTLNDSALTGDHELDVLLAIRLTQSALLAKTSNEINAGSIDDVPQKVMKSINELGSDPHALSIMSKDVPGTIEDEETVDSAFVNLLDQDEPDIAQGTAKGTLAKSLKMQIKTVSTAATAEDDSVLAQFGDLIRSSVKEIGTTMIAQTIGNTLDDIIQKLEKSPEQAINEALDALKRQTAGADGFEDWNVFLEGLQNAINNTVLWQAISDAIVSGDITDLLAMGGFALGGSTDSTSDGDDIDIQEQTDNTDETDLSGVYDYSGTYMLELKLIDAVFTKHPNFSGSGFTDNEEYTAYINDIIEELETASYYEDWRNPVGKIEIKHDINQGAISVAILGSEFQDVFILNDNDRYYQVFTKAHTIEFRGENAEKGDAFGKMTFDVGLDDEIIIVGTLTVFNPGQYADVQRSFEISGVECKSDGPFIW